MSMDVYGRHYQELPPEQLHYLFAFAALKQYERELEEGRRGG